jgi:hypothetical protein
LAELLRQHSARRTLADPRPAAAAAMVAAAHPWAAAEAAGAAERFAPELADYGELIRNRRGDLAGFMVRGEDADFAARVRSQLADFATPEEALRQQERWLAEIGPQRTFLKLEWQATPAGVPSRLAALYVRRRLPVADAVALIAAGAAGALPTAHFHTLARLLGKETVHFISLACRPGEPVHYKLYFSQLQDAVNREAVQVRLGRALATFAPHRAALARWAAYHDRLAPAGPERTLFVSLAMTRNGVQPSIKIDYPGVAPDVAVAVLDVAEQQAAADGFADLCRRAGTERLSFLGLRLGVGAIPVLKGYADFP